MTVEETMEDRNNSYRRHEDCPRRPSFLWRGYVNGSDGGYYYRHHIDDNSGSNDDRGRNSYSGSHKGYGRDDNYAGSDNGYGGGRHVHAGGYSREERGNRTVALVAATVERIAKTGDVMEAMVLMESGETVVDMVVLRWR